MRTLYCLLPDIHITSTQKSIFHPLYTTYLVLLWICLLINPPKIISVIKTSPATIHTLPQSKTYSSNHVYVRQTWQIWHGHVGIIWKCMAELLHSILNAKIEVPRYPPLLTQHHPPTLETSTHPTKNALSSKHFTQFDSLPSDLIHNIYMYHLSLVHCDNSKTVWYGLTRHDPVLCASKFYKLKYFPL